MSLLKFLIGITIVLGLITLGRTYASTNRHEGETITLDREDCVKAETEEQELIMICFLGSSQTDRQQHENHKQHSDR